jgi:radical SAM superfamily enzyme YgiQ (UPF0313 family)
MRKSLKDIQPLRQLLDAERNRARKPFGSGWNVALVYPNTYHVAMSNLGFQFAYRTISSHPDFVCERFFTDSLFSRTASDAPLSLESRRPLSDFHVIAFSVSYELDYVNVLRFLSRSNIPLLAKDRSPSSPLILVGGIAMTINPNPIADFVDLIACGDGEATLDSFLRAFTDSHASKQRTLDTLAALPGFLVPALAPESTFLEPTIAIQSPENLSPAHTTIFTPHTEFPNTCLIEIARGCPYGCRFCFSGNSPLPYRAFPLDTIRPVIEQSIPFTNRFGFISSAVARHPEIGDLCDFAAERNLLISFSSLHLLDISLPILTALVRSHQKTLTIAPEAGNESLRRRLGKNVPDQRILEIAQMSVRSGMQNLKLYFLLGAPDESLDDVKSIIQLVKNIRAVFFSEGKKNRRIGAIRIQPSLFVPKPRTPCANEPMLDPAELRRRILILRRGLASLGNVRLLPVSIHEALAQKILSLGDRTASQFLLLALRHAGNWRSAFYEWQRRP